MDIKIKEEDKNNLEQTILDLIRHALKSGLIDSQTVHNIAYEF